MEIASVNRTWRRKRAALAVVAVGCLPAALVAAPSPAEAAPDTTATPVLQEVAAEQHWNPNNVGRISIQVIAGLAVLGSLAAGIHEGRRV
jgi:peptidoglycan/LPS O-acetylase OafA/YrhL